MYILNLYRTEMNITNNNTYVYKYVINGTDINYKLQTTNNKYKLQHINYKLQTTNYKYRLQNININCKI